MHWIAREKLIEAKKDGGLGLRDLEAFHIALLGKQVQRLLIKPNLLLSRVMKNKSFSKSDIFQAKSKVWDSWFWKSCNEAKTLIRESCRQTVGTGINIKTMRKMVQSRSMRKAFTPKLEKCTIQKVSELLNQLGGGWNEELIIEIFYEERSTSYFKHATKLNGDKGSTCLDANQEWTIYCLFWIQN